MRSVVRFSSIAPLALQTTTFNSSRNTFCSWTLRSLDHVAVTATAERVLGPIVEEKELIGDVA
jgi:hypothetical protein